MKLFNVNLCFTTYGACEVKAEDEHEAICEARKLYGEGLALNWDNEPNEWKDAHMAEEITEKKCDVCGVEIGMEEWLENGEPSCWDCYKALCPSCLTLSEDELYRCPQHAKENEGNGEYHHAEPLERELTQKEIDRQDYVDGVLWKAVCDLVPARESAGYDGEIVGALRDVLIDMFKLPDSFYPSICTGETCESCGHCTEGG